MKKLGLIFLLILNMGCMKQSRFEGFLDKEYDYADHEYEKKMIGVSYKIKENEFIISNKGNYNWNDKTGKYETCHYDLNHDTELEGSICDEHMIQIIKQTQTAFFWEMERLDASIEELNGIFIE